MITRNRSLTELCVQTFLSFLSAVPEGKKQNWEEIFMVIRNRSPTETMGADIIVLFVRCPGV